MSPFGFLAGLLIILVLQPECQAAWQNDFDERLNFQCHDDSYAITSVKSTHNGWYEDRRFELGCTKVDTSTNQACYWTNYVNFNDRPIRFSCRPNYYINGMSSVHSNWYEDRRWRYRCCSAPSRTLTGCEFTGWTNTFDNDQDYSVPIGHVITGVVSVHHNWYEDRVYEYLVCNMATSPSRRGYSSTKLSALQSVLRSNILDSEYPRVPKEEYKKAVAEDELSPSAIAALKAYLEANLESDFPAGPKDEDKKTILDSEYPSVPKEEYKKTVTEDELSPSAIAALKDYLEANLKTDFPEGPKDEDKDGVRDLSSRYWGKPVPV